MSLLYRNVPNDIWLGSSALVGVTTAGVIIRVLYVLRHYATDQYPHADAHVAAVGLRVMRGVYILTLVSACVLGIQMSPLTSPVNGDYWTIDAFTTGTWAIIRLAAVAVVVGA